MSIKPSLFSPRDQSHTLNISESIIRVDSQRQGSQMVLNSPSNIQLAKRASLPKFSRRNVGKVNPVILRYIEMTDKPYDKKKHANIYFGSKEQRGKSEEGHSPVLKVPLRNKFQRFFKQQQQLKATPPANSSFSVGQHTSSQLKLDSSSSTRSVQPRLRFTRFIKMSRKEQSIGTMKESLFDETMAKSRDTQLSPDVIVKESLLPSEIGSARSLKPGDGETGALRTPRQIQQEVRQLVKGFETLRESSHFLRKSRETKLIGAGSSIEAEHSQRLFIPAEVMGEMSHTMSEEEKQEHIARAMKKLSHSTLKGLILSMSREFNQEARSYNSPIVHLEDFLSKSNSQKEHLSTPNTFSTVTAMQILDVLANCLPLYGTIIGNVRDTLMNSVFYNYKEMKILLEKIERKQARHTEVSEERDQDEVQRMKTSFAELVPFHDVIRDRDEEIAKLKQKIIKLEHYGRRKAQLELQFAKLMLSNSKEKEMKLLKRVIDGWRMNVRPSVNCVIQFANFTCSQRLKRKAWLAFRQSINETKAGAWELERNDYKTKIIEQSKSVLVHTKRTSTLNEEVTSLKFKLNERVEEINTLQKKLKVIVSSMGNFNPQTIKQSIGNLIESLLLSHTFKKLPKQIMWENQSLVPLLIPSKTIGEAPYHEQISLMKQWNINTFLLRWVNFSAQEAYRKIKQEIRSVHNPSERIANGFLSFTSSEDLELLDSLALREVKSFLDVTPLVIVLSLYHQHQKPDLVVDILTISKEPKERRKCEHVASLIHRFTGITNLCSIIDLVEKDPRNLSTLLSFFYLNGPCLPIPESKHVETSSHDIVMKVNIELCHTQSMFDKLRMGPHLSNLYSNIPDINKDSPTEFILRWVNNVIQYSSGFLGAQNSKRVRSFEELNQNNYELVQKILNGLTQMKEFNHTTQIGKLQAYVKKENRLEETKDKADMVCVKIVNQIMAITGRQDLVFLHELASKPKQPVSWEPIMIQLFLNRPLIFERERGSSREQRTLEIISDCRDILEEYWAADTWGKPLNTVEKSAKKLIEAFKLFSELDSEYAMLQERLRKRRDFALNQERRSDFVRERLVFTSNVSVSSHPRMLVADQVFLKEFNEMTILEPLLAGQIQDMLYEYSAPITTLLAFYLGEKNYFSYIDMWSLMKSVQIDRHGVDVTSIESHFLKSKTPVASKINTDVYSFRLSIEDFWRVVLVLTFQVFDEELNRNIDLDPDQQRSLHAFTFRRFITHCLLKERCSFFEFFKNHPYRHHLLVKEVQSYIMKERIDAFVGVYQYYSKGRGYITGIDFLKIMKDALVTQESLIEPHIDDILQDCLEVSYKKPDTTTELTSESLSQDSDRERNLLLRGKMVFYDFVECLYHLSQFSHAHLESQERFEHFVESVLFKNLLKHLRKSQEETDELKTSVVQALPKQLAQRKLKRRPTLI